MTHVLDKRTPSNLTDHEKIEFTKNLLSKFIRKTKNANSVTNLIFNQVKHDYETNNQYVMSICGVLISFVLNSESHLYFAMESIIEAKNRLGITNFEVEDIFSIESSVIQNTKNVTDINAIRNAVSHSAFDIKFEPLSNEYIIDLQSILSNYRFKREYTARELLNLYRHYDKLRDIQELFIRMAFLKSTLKLFFIRPSCFSVTSISH